MRNICVVLLCYVCSVHAQLYIAQERQIPEVRAFLDVMACIEGTYDHGYRMKFGGARFTDYSDHPREEVPYVSKGERRISTAAGRYQFSIDEWDTLREGIHARQFTPIQQDYAMIYLLRMSGAIEHIKHHRVVSALYALQPYKESVSRVLSDALPHCSVEGLRATFSARQRYYAAREKRMPDVLTRYLRRADVRAFLDVIAAAEGTYKHAGYYERFPHVQMESLEAHPQTAICAQSNGKTLCSSAAGRYQLLRETWSILAWRIAAHDFSPREQNRAAVQMLLDRKIIQALDNNDLETALTRASKGWASLPKSPHQQPVKGEQFVKDIFKRSYTYYAGK